MGAAAALDVAKRLRVLAQSQDEIRVVFPAAPSQNEFLRALIVQEDLPWQRVTAFHMDEYLGLPADAEQLFGHFLRERLFDRVPLKQVHYLDPEPEDIQAECSRYATLLQKAPIDLVCLGIGENGHLAFNDPPVADFDDPAVVKAVELDEVCRQQQVNDGAFPRFDAVPTHALTLTIPALLASKSCIAVVPGPTKTKAVAATLQGPIATSCPASILRRHSDATLYLDSDAAAQVTQTPASA